VQGVTPLCTEEDWVSAGKSFGLTPLADRLQLSPHPKEWPGHDAVASVLRYNYAIFLFLESTVW
jgi:hypothetical protein